MQEQLDARAAELTKATEQLRRQTAAREKVEQALRESKALYQSLLEGLPLNLFRKDLEGRVVMANRRYCETLEQPLDELLGKTDYDLFPDELADKYRRDDQTVIETGSVFEDVERHRRPNGEWLYVQVFKSPARDAQGKIIGVQVMFWDVTARRRAEESLLQERFLLRSLMDNVPVYIYFKDTKGRFIRINRALAQKFRLADPTYAEGKTDFDFFTKEHAMPAYRDEQRIIRSGEGLVNKEEKETHLDGRVRWALTTKMPLRDKEGKLVGTFGISHDITERKQAQDELRKAKEAAEAASQAKSTFLANMSHEIRTPLNAVLGMTELVLDTDLTPLQRDYLMVVQESGDALLSVIGDILDFSKIEAGHLDLDHAAFDLREYLGDTIKLLALRAHHKGLELACRIAPDLPRGVLGDKTRLRQVLVNLLGNAIKFTERGEVSLEATVDEKTDHDVLVHFAVRDTGIGIARDKHAAIFDAFEQADNTMTRRFGGTGLGLAISSRLVHLMNGKIWLDSDLGSGSTFHCTARLALDPAVTEDEPAFGETSDGLRVLVVDDNATSRAILVELLTAWRMRPTAVSSPAEARAEYDAACSAGESFPVVLCDATLPGEEAFELVHQLRNGAGSPRFIMLLAPGQRPGDVARCERMGLASYLIKPIKQSELLEALVEQADVGRPFCPIGSNGDDGGRLRPLRILLAEDSLVNQKLALGLMGKHGHHVTAVQSGRQALEAVAKNEFDLVLMDIQMPELDGLSATREIRQIERQTGRHLPIVAMTAHALKGDREQCLAAGMDGYVTKPVRARELFDAIAEVLGETALADAGAAAVSYSSSPSEVSQVMDWSVALDAVGGDRDLLKEIVAAFLEEYPGLLLEIRRTIDRGDAAGLRLAAHRLKGSMRYFAATRAFDHAYILETKGREGDLADTAVPLAVLEQEINRLTPILNAFLSEK
jgi:PAS domain S-box-containing protein